MWQCSFRRCVKMTSLHDGELRLEQAVPLIRELLAMGRTVQFGPRGKSMRPMLRQGRDKVVLSAVTGRLKKYDLPLYQRDDGQYILHRIVEIGETYTCIGDNQHVLEYGVRDDQIIAVVTAFIRDGREIPVSSIGYRIYCRVWHWLRPVKRILGKVKRAIQRRLLRKHK